MRAKRLLFLLIAAIGLTGCQQQSKPTWGEWRFEGFEERQEQFAVVVTSEPAGATVVVDGQEIGTTPLTADLPYSETVVVLERHQTDQRDPERRVLDTQQDRRNTTVGSTVHEITLTKEGYLDQRIPLVIPLESTELNVQLIRSPLVQHIDCVLSITAREEYFESIEEVVRAFDPEAVKEPREDPTPLADQLNVGQQTFTLSFSELSEFEQMVRQMQALAEDSDFVFHMTSLAAEFDTNILQGTVEHIVTGRVRRNSALYVVRSGRKPLPGDVVTVGEDGMYRITVSLTRGQSDIHLLSIYSPPNNRSTLPLTVFMTLDVYTQDATELTRTAFEQATNVAFPDALIGELAVRGSDERLAVGDQEEEEEE